MGFRTISVLFWVGIICCLQNFSSAQDAPTDQDIRAFKHPLTDMPPGAEDVATSVYFPNHADHKLPIGEVVTTLCHFTNTGSSPYNISAIMGSLNAPFDFRHHFQNYSYKPIGMVVNAGEEISLKYSFQLHPDLEPVDYQLAVTVFYDSETESFSTTFFNQVSKFIDVQLLVLIDILLASDC
jgi:translocon-associated protein subunit alpha